MDDIRFCERNLEKFGEFVIKKVEDDLENITTEVEECLDFCEDCAKEPFAIVNGEYIGADTVENLYEEVLTALGREYELS